MEVLHRTLNVICKKADPPKLPLSENESRLESHTDLRAGSFFTQVWLECPVWFSFLPGAALWIKDGVCLCRHTLCVIVQWMQNIPGLKQTPRSVGA